MPKSKKVTISEFYCTKCGKKTYDLPRKLGRQREAGHLKKLYCIYCKEENNCAEVRPFGDYNYEDFELEYNLGRFVNGQKIPTNELIECSKEECSYNVNGRCWNSKEDFDCGHRLIEKLLQEESDE